MTKQTNVINYLNDTTQLRYHLTLGGSFEILYSFALPHAFYGHYILRLIITTRSCHTAPPDIDSYIKLCVQTCIRAEQ